MRTDGQANRQTDKQTNRQTDKPTKYQNLFGVVKTSRSAGRAGPRGRGKYCYFFFEKSKFSEEAEGLFYNL